MSEAGITAKFDSSGNVLRVTGEIGFDDEAVFTQELQRFIAEHEPPFTVDLTDVSFMSSSCVRIVAAAIVAAGHNAPKLRVVAKKKILRLFELAGIDNIGSLELVEEE